MNDTKLVGKVEELISALQGNAAALNAKGIAVITIVTELEAKKGTLVSTSAEQENLKTSLKDKTEEANQANRDLYETFSNRIDAACLAVGRKTNLAKQIAKIRSSLRAKNNASDDTEDGSDTPISKAA